MGTDTEPLWTTDLQFDSSVIVGRDSDRVFVQNQSDFFQNGSEDECQLIALDRETGGVEWRKKMPSLGNCTHGENTLYFATGDQLVAVDSTTGAVEFVERFADDIYSDLKVRGQRLYVYTRNQNADRYEWFALDSDGNRRWSFRKQHATIFMDTIDGDVVFRAEDALHCVDGRTGSVQWTERADSPTPVVDGKIYSGVRGSRKTIRTLDARSGEVRRTESSDTYIGLPKGVVDRHVIYSSFGSGVAISMETDRIAWTRDEAGRDRMVRLGGGVRKGQLFTLADSEYLYLIPTEDDTHKPVAAIEASTGRDVWEFPVAKKYPTVWDVPTVDTTLVVDDGTVYGIETSTGTTRWSHDVPEEPYLEGAGEQVFVRNTDGIFHVIEAESGSLVWRYEFDDAGHRINVGSIESTDNTIYLCDDDGTVYALARYPDADRHPGSGNTAVYGEQDSDTDTRVFTDDATYCPDCGTDLTAYGDVNFCPECGADLTA